ncbi:hypothetical protein PORCRE_748 [Porphyromonas crevioricanis JCM 15906]|uniref:Uncharacterized protein n=1 Tax=Porphyromonas crevioricanis JCM 15906 TaxID=1305617 RepID=T1DR19_9PORP|nr:hypothetical protein PORCRE_748 [Porphyromonas crevioricanis JCM 15906]
MGISEGSKLSPERFFTNTGEKVCSHRREFLFSPVKKIHASRARNF